MCLIWQLGLDGLYELIEVNPKLFRKFESSTLFDNESKQFERIVVDKEVNDKLDKEIQEFLIAVSPYLMMKASLKCLEWLVNRYDCYII